MQEWSVARLDDIAEPGALEFTAGAGDWPFRGVAVRWDGKVYAYANVCPHQRHPLNLTPDGFFNPQRTLLLCASHGAVFEPATGRCIAGPCTGASLVPLECRVVDGEVRVTAPASQRDWPDDLSDDSSD